MLVREVLHLGPALPSGLASMCVRVIYRGGKSTENLYSTLSEKKVKAVTGAVPFQKVHFYLKGAYWDHNCTNIP